MKTSDTGQQNLLLVRATANPADPEAGQLFLLKGDATRENLNLEISTGAQLPAAWHYDNQPFQLKILHFNDLHGQVARMSRKGKHPLFFQRWFRASSTLDPRVGEILYWSIGLIRRRRYYRHSL